MSTWPGVVAPPSGVSRFQLRVVWLQPLYRLRESRLTLYRLSSPAHAYAKVMNKYGDQITRQKPIENNQSVNSEYYLPRKTNNVNERERERERQTDILLNDN